mgnify:FL=1
MIVFETQKDFEDAVMDVLCNRLILQMKSQRTIYGEDCTEIETSILDSVGDRFIAYDSAHI